MAQRCSEWPGGATHFGSGWAAKSAACSASERKPETTSSEMPAALAAPRPSGRRPRPRRASCPRRRGRRAGRCSRRRWQRWARRRRASAGAAASASAEASTRVPPAPSTRAPTTALACSGAKETRSGNVEPQAVGVDAVGSASRERRCPGPCQVDELVDVGRVRDATGKGRRREQARQVVAHRPRRRDRRQVGGPLDPALAGDRAGDRDQRQGGRDQREGAAQGQQQRLAGLLARQPGEAGSTERLGVPLHTLTLAIKPIPVVRSIQRF